MFEQPEKRIKINCSQDVYSCMTPYLYDEPVEHFYILLLDRNHQVLKILKISSGGTNATLADPELFFKKALDHLASGIILIHYVKLYLKNTTTPPEISILPNRIEC